MKIVSITSQGQISIPAKFRRELGLEKSGRAMISIESQKLVIKPVKTLLDIAGSLISTKSYNSSKVRDEFEKALGEGTV